MSEEKTPKFICDEMLKKLARWLRILGFDTTAPSVKDDNELVILSKKEKRILLTRDKDLSGMTGVKAIRVFSDDLEEQLIEIMDHFPPDRYTVHCTRCPSCNGELIVHDTRDSDNILKGSTEVPPDVLTIHDRIYICEGCGKIYWTGSHWDNILKRMDRIGVNPILPGKQ